MPERLAKTDPFTADHRDGRLRPVQIRQEEYQPGHKVVYVKNPDYVPRSEPPDWASGGKVVKVDRVEWLVVPEPRPSRGDSDGEVDWWENPPPDYLADARRQSRYHDGLRLPRRWDCVRFNWLYPPFDNVKMRQAVMMVADQPDYMTAFVGDQKIWNACPRFFTCGGPMANNSARVADRKARLRQGQAADQGGRLQGREIVLLDAVDQPLIHAEALVTTDC